MSKAFLTPKQKQVLDYILSFTQEQGYAPSQQEVAEHFGFSSLGTVQHYLTQLQQQGHLQKSWNARRGMKVKQADDKLPLLGRVAAGRPIESVRAGETIEVPSFLRRMSGEHFVLEVKGDSMIEDGILEGDYVVIRKQASAENGETVVALINNGATIKRYQKRSGRIELHPANPNYKPLIVDSESEDFKIEGVFVGLIRRAQ